MTGLFIAAFAGAFLFGCISAFWGLVVPTLESSLGKEAVPNILLANSIGLVVGSLVVGPVIDRSGKKMAMSGGMLLVAAGVSGLGMVNSAAAAMAMAVMIGAGGSSSIPLIKPCQRNWTCMRSWTTTARTRPH